MCATFGWVLPVESASPGRCDERAVRSSGSGPGVRAQRLERRAGRPDLEPHVHGDRNSHGHRNGDPDSHGDRDGHGDCDGHADTDGHG
jgi:hypothetical protein